MSPLLYLKVFIGLAFMVLIFWGYHYISSAFEERDKLRISEALKTVQISQYQKALADNARLQENMADALSKIRRTSNTYISTIDNGRMPVVPSGTVIQLFAGGMLSEVPSMPTFTNASTNSTQPVSEAD